MPLILRRADGGVSILRLIDAQDAAEEIAKWEASAPPEWLPATSIQAEEADIPGDRTWRDAWAMQGGKIDVAIDKAKEVQKARLRAERAPKLAALDVQYMRAIEAKDNKLAAEIAAKKQALRDITADPRIAAATTTQELAAITLP